MSDSFITQENLKWFWISLATLILFSVFYLIYTPVGGHSGGTVYGYISGSISALGMLFLIWYAARKRSYFSTAGTLKLWLGAHVWVGILLLFLVPLHAGFSFGCNLHTVCYILMVITILTGIWGMYLFVAVPQKLQARREGLSLNFALKEIDLISSDIEDLGKGKSAGFLKLLNVLDVPFNPKLFSIIFSRVKVIDPTTLPNLPTLLTNLSESELNEAHKLITLAHKKAELSKKFVDEVRLTSLLQLWLYLHVPVASAAFMLLVVHIFSVFYRW